MNFKKQFKEELIDKNVWHCLNDTQIERVSNIAEQQLQLYIVSQQSELSERLYKLENWAYNKASEDDLAFLNKIFKH